MLICQSFLCMNRTSCYLSMAVVSVLAYVNITVLASLLLVCVELLFLVLLPVLNK